MMREHNFRRRKGDYNFLVSENVQPRVINIPKHFHKEGSQILKAKAGAKRS